MAERGRNRSRLVIRCRHSRCNGQARKEIQELDLYGLFPEFDRVKSRDRFHLCRKVYSWIDNVLRALLPLLRHNVAMTELTLRPMTDAEYAVMYSKLIVEYAAVNVEGEYVGHLWIGLDRPGAPGSGWIYDIEVGEQQRGKGYGRTRWRENCMSPLDIR